MQPEGIWG
jgi:hypothetical protein